MNKRKYHANNGILTFEEINVMDDEEYIKVNRNFIYYTIARYQILNQPETFDIILPYMNIIPDDKKSNYQMHLFYNAPYVAMTSQDVKKIFSQIPQDAFRKNTFRKMCKIENKTFFKTKWIRIKKKSHYQIESEVFKWKN